MVGRPDTPPTCRSLRELLPYRVRDQGGAQVSYKDKEDPEALQMSSLRKAGLTEINETANSSGRQPAQSQPEAS